MSGTQLLPPTIPSLADILHRHYSPSPKPSTNGGDCPTNRMHIHIDMTEPSRYLSPGAHHHGDAMQVDASLGAGTCSSGPPTTVAYSAQDLTPFSAVSSFNYPATADTTLLTPVSGAGSPPTQQRVPKPMHSYVPCSTGGAQQPTPPTSSRLFDTYNVHPSSQSSSPLTAQPPSAESFELGYLPGVNTSPRDEIPPHPAPYYGHFGVSESTDVDNPAHFNQPYHPFVSNVDVDSAAFFGRHPNVQVGNTEMYHGLPTSGSTPILTQPHPNQFRRAGSTIEDLRGDPNLLHQMSHPNQQMYAAAQVSNGASPRGKRRPSGKRPPKSRPARRAGSDPLSRPQTAASTQGDEDEDGGAPRLTLDERASEEEKFLLETRQRLQSEKGKGMWDGILKSYMSKFGGEITKQALQMKMSRLVRRNAVWPETEEELLRKVWLEDEGKRFARYAARMKEMGGMKTWNWSPADIEAKLVKLGFEEARMDEESKLRKRKRSAARRRSAASSSAHPSSASHHDATALALGWAAHLGGLHHHAQQQYRLPQPGRGYDVLGDGLGLGGDGGGGSAAVSHVYTSDQENDVLDQLERKYPPHHEAYDEAMDDGADDVKSEPAGLMHHAQQQQQQHVPGAEGMSPMQNEQMVARRYRSPHGGI